MNLHDYVGRSFVLQRTRYGALDGLIAKIVRVETVPSLKGDREVLVAETSSEEFPVGMVMPINLGAEVKR